jgi:DnaJ-class molecular chaperone
MSAGAERGARTECSPCRGTGKVISALGGTQQQVTCPWCDGTGVFQRGRDAQAAQGHKPE